MTPSLFLLRTTAWLLQRSFVILCVLLCIAPNVLCQTTEKQGQELAKEAVLKLLGRSQHSYIEITRDTLLENKLRAYLAQTSLQPFYIFRATNEGRETEKESVTEHLSVEGRLDIIVVITNAGRAFIIKGAANSKRELEQLAKEFRVLLSTPESARNFMMLYLDVNPENYVMSVLTPPSRLAETAERRFTDELGEAAGIRDFNRWWNSYGSKFERKDFSLIIGRTPKGFSGNFYVLSDFGAKKPTLYPRVLHGLIEISAQGEVRRLTFRPIKPFQEPVESR